MKRLLASLTLLVVLVLVLACGLTVIGCLPLMIFDDPIENAIKNLAHAVVA